MTAEDQRAANAVFVNVGKAIAAYEHRLLSNHSPFDEFVEGLRGGDSDRIAALSPEAQRGLKLFIGTGECRLCHSGPNFTDGEFHDIRVPPREGGQPRDAGRFGGLRNLLEDPFNAAGEYSDDREGSAARRLRFTVNGPENWGRFKTPSLRNVALTAPYMHQGQFESLEEVVEYYSTLEGAVVADHHDEAILVPRDFTEQEKRDLVAFLRSLTDDDLDPSLLEAPASPRVEPAGEEQVIGEKQADQTSPEMDAQGSS
jgi:cytochrome c peroxidase